MGCAFAIVFTFPQRRGYLLGACFRESLVIRLHSELGQIHHSFCNWIRILFLVRIWFSRGSSSPSYSGTGFCHQEAHYMVDWRWRAQRKPNSNEEKNSNPIPETVIYVPRIFFISIIFVKWDSLAERFFALVLNGNMLPQPSLWQIVGGNSCNQLQKFIWIVSKLQLYILESLNQCPMPINANQCRSKYWHWSEIALNAAILMGIDQHWLALIQGVIIRGVLYIAAGVWHNAIVYGTVVENIAWHLTWPIQEKNVWSVNSSLLQLALLQVTKFVSSKWHL